MLTECDLQRKSVQYRQALLRLIKAANAGHTGGDLSCLDLLNVPYNRVLRVSPQTFGIALAGKMDRKDYRVFCLRGDGELAEGSNWEAAQAALA